MKAALLPYLLAAAACSSSSGGTTDAPSAHDGASGDGRAIDGGSNVDDGSPTRQACTSAFGHDLPASGTFGRLDGYLVSIVAPSNSQPCNADDSHVHLQIQMNGGIYDIAIDVTDAQTGSDDVHTLGIVADMPGDMPWAEGWHDGVLGDYVALGVHSTAMPLNSKQQNIDAINAVLQTANHVSIYTTTYGDDGAHLVHRNGGGHDGILVTEPLSTPSNLQLFSFTSQTF